MTELLASNDLILADGDARRTKRSKMSHHESEICLALLQNHGNFLGDATRATDTTLLVRDSEGARSASPNGPFFLFRCQVSSSWGALARRGIRHPLGRSI